MNHFKNTLTRLLKAQGGIAYVEFAITLPFLIALFLGAVEVTRYIIIVQKLEKVSVTMSDIVSQETTIGTTDLNTLIDAAGQVMQPFTFGTSTSSYVIISSVTKTGTANPIVNWQYTGGGSWTHSSLVGTTNSTATLPTGFTMADKDNVIITEVFYNYTPLMGAIIGDVLPSGLVYKEAVFKPRLGTLSTLGS